MLYYCKGGEGYILYRGRQAIWETNTFPEMREWMKKNGIEAEYRPTSIAVFR